jgi:uncharacterized BrkB/YihY/UPF0761 family membrane protein
MEGPAELMAAAGSFNEEVVARVYLLLAVALRENGAMDLDYLLMVTAGIPAMLGFLLLVAGGAAIEATEQAYGLPDPVVTTLDVLRWPIGAVLDLAAITALFHWSPRRRQPGPSWLAIGAGLSVLLWLLFTGGLALYVARSASFGQVYGPLTGIFALLLWSQLTSIALLLGIAFAAQLEAVRAGVPSPVAVDPEENSLPTSSTVVLTPEPRSPDLRSAELRSPDRTPRG